MVSNDDQYSNCTSPTLNKTNYISHFNRLNLHGDNKSNTPWIRGEVIHEGNIEQYQLNLDNNNYKMKHLTKINNHDINHNDNWNKVKTSSPSPSSSSSSPSSSSPSSSSPSSSSSSSSSPSTDSDFVSNDISQSLSSSSSSSSSSSPSNSSPTSSSPSTTSSSSSNDEYKQLQRKSKSSLNLSISSMIIYDTYKNEDDINVNHHMNDNIQKQNESIEYNNDHNNNQKEGKSGNMNDYLTLVWDDLPET
ncbi:unnamed protein product [Schistosoma spindalis]|nr:unnamed protein product [Schistosoma spindale]